MNLYEEMSEIRSRLAKIESQKGQLANVDPITPLINKSKEITIKAYQRSWMDVVINCSELCKMAAIEVEKNG